MLKRSYSSGPKFLNNLSGEEVMCLLRFQDGRSYFNQVKCTYFCVVLELEYFNALSNLFGILMLFNNM